MKTKILFRTLIFSSVIFSAFLISCSGGTSTKVTEEADEDTTEAQVVDVKKELWNYSESEDKMTGEKRYFAECKSTNQINFEFPYDGGTTFTLTIRNMGKGNAVILSGDKCQFTSSYSGSETCRVKFDDADPVNYSYNMSADGSSDLIFFTYQDNFISKLKGAKKLMIEAPFYDAGKQIIEFDVEGLKWDK